MKETLFCSNGQDITRVKRAFKWVITFRDFPVGSWQTVDRAMMLDGSLTLFTKGRAEFWLGETRRNDRVPGTLSTELEIPVSDESFKLVYIEPTTRLCIPARINQGRLPTVTKVMLEAGENIELEGHYLVCLGSMSVNSKKFDEERTFVTEGAIGTALDRTILLKFHDPR